MNITTLFFGIILGFVITFTQSGPVFANAKQTDSVSNWEDKIKICVNVAFQLAFSDEAAAATLAVKCDEMLTDSGIDSNLTNQALFAVIMIEEHKLSKMLNLTDLARSNAGGKDGINAVLTSLAFTSDTQANGYYNSTRLKQVSNKLGSPHLILVANLVYMATLLNDVSSLGSDTNNPGPTLVAISSCKNLTGGCTVAVQKAVAQSALEFRSSACADSTKYIAIDVNDLCNKAKAITDDSSSLQIILNGLNSYANQSHSNDFLR